ncbi:MAG: M48 family metallopeptidase [Longimicrobiales bacterium]
MFAFQKWIRKAAMPGILAGSVAVGTSCGISTAQEQQMGQQYATQINSQLPIVNDASANRYLTQLGTSIAQRGQRRIPYRFFIVNSEVVNAFAVPGGYVYVNRGLIEAADNVSELAGVVAHEIGHVEERHSVEQLERVQGANLGLNLAFILLGRAPSGVESAAINVGGGAFFARYSRGAEDEADAVAVRLLVASGIHPNGLVTFFNELIAERQRRPSQLEQWFSTHPTTEDWIRHVQGLIARVPRSQLQGLPMAGSGFDTFKANLRRYPAPPRQTRAR